MDDVVIVGGGVGGTVTANLLAEELAPDIAAGNVRIRLITDRAEHVYKPAFLYVAFGRTAPRAYRRPQRELLHPAVELIVDPVRRVDTGQSRVDGEKRAVLPVHVPCAGRRQPGGARENPRARGSGRAVLHRGRRPAPVPAPGRLRRGDRGGIGHRGAPHVPRGSPGDGLHAGRVFPGAGTPGPGGAHLHVPHQPGAQQPGHRGMGGAPAGGPQHPHRDVLQRGTDRSPAKVIETMEGTTLSFDLLIGIPEHTAPPFLEASGLAEDGWVPADRHTLQVKGHDNVYALGDVTNLAVSKAGSVAHYQASTVAANLAARIRGLPATARYGGKTFCFIETGNDEATYVEFDYDHPPRPVRASRWIHWAKLAYNQSYWMTARGVL